MVKSAYPPPPSPKRPKAMPKKIGKKVAKSKAMTMPKKMSATKAMKSKMMGY